MKIESSAEVSFESLSAWVVGIVLPLYLWNHGLPKDWRLLGLSVTVTFISWVFIARQLVNIWKSTRHKQ